MTENEFVGKWQLRFRNNDLFEIDEGDLREFAHDIASTFGQEDTRAVFEHIFENQYGKHPEFSAQAPLNAYLLQLLTVKQMLAAPDAPEFTLFDDAANSVVLSHPQYSYVDLRYDVPGGAVGLPVPADGLIRPGNIAGQLVGYVRAAGGRLQSQKAYSPVFTSVTFTPQVRPTAPRLTNFDDVANTVNVYHPNYSYVELRYNFNGQTGLLVSADGLISVGNVAGQVEVYVVADAAKNRVQGLPAYSPPFTTGSVVVTPPAGAAPTVTGFGPGSAAVGAAVTITGTNFTGATALLFNGTPAAFTVLNATTINATVPVGATTGPIAVATAAGTGQSTASFTVTTSTTPAALAVAFTLPNGNSLTVGQNLSFSAAASGGVAPYSHEVSATNTATGTVVGVGSAIGAQYSGMWQSVPAGTYELVDTVTDAAGTVKISAVRTVTVTAAPAAPTVTINSVIVGTTSTGGGSGLVLTRIDFKNAPASGAEGASVAFAVEGTYTDPQTSLVSKAPITDAVLGAPGYVFNGYALNIPGNATLGDTRTITITASKGSFTTTTQFTILDATNTGPKRLSTLGLLNYYRFTANNGLGILDDSSTNALVLTNAGAVVGAGVYTTDGNSYGGRTLNAQKDQFLNGFTIDFRFRLNGPTANQYGYSFLGGFCLPIAAADGGGGPFIPYLVYSSGTSATLHLQSQDADKVLHDVALPAMDFGTTWHRLRGKWDPATQLLSLRLDDGEYVSVPQASIITNTRDLHLGHDSQSAGNRASYGFNGSLADVQLWTIATEQDAVALYAQL